MIRKLLSGIFDRPITPATLTPRQRLILMATLHEWRSGLEIARAIESVHSVKVSVGSLYPTLYRLERHGLIKSRWDEERSDERGGNRRRYYACDARGKWMIEQVLKKELR